MIPVLEYKSHDTEGPVDIVEVDTSATTRGTTITTRRNRHHEGTVLAARVQFLANREAADAAHHTP